MMKIQNYHPYPGRAMISSSLLKKKFLKIKIFKNHVIMVVFQDWRVFVLLYHLGIQNMQN